MTLMKISLYCGVYFSAPCNVPYTQRRDCGYIGIPTEECLNKGCCYEKVTNVPSCYPKTIG
jgi:hypothetical protein